MDYKIKKIKGFGVCGLQTEITKNQKRNMDICKTFWVYFNQELKRNRLTQNTNWKNMRSLTSVITSIITIVQFQK